MIFKTHDPIDIGVHRNINVNKTICIVRNPFDVFFSKFQFELSGSHSITLQADFKSEKVLDLIAKRVQTQIDEFKTCHNKYIEMARRGLPVFFIRYEDTIDNKFVIFSEAMSFIWNQKSI